MINSFAGKLNLVTYKKLQWLINNGENISRCRPFLVKWSTILNLGVHLIKLRRKLYVFYIALLIKLLFYHSQILFFFQLWYWRKKITTTAHCMLFCSAWVEYINSPSQVNNTLFGFCLGKLLICFKEIFLNRKTTKILHKVHKE